MLYTMTRDHWTIVADGIHDSHIGFPEAMVGAPIDRREMTGLELTIAVEDKLRNLILASLAATGEDEVSIYGHEFEARELLNWYEDEERVEIMTQLQ
jgi:hypothetical protein